MRRGLALALVVAWSCASVPPGPAVVFDTASGSARVRVEIADTDELRQKGLMGRTGLADDAGMLFVWPADTNATFWMKDTRIPLSIAFLASDGRVVALLDMEPCRNDPCPTYDPHLAYRMALETTRGAYARWGVRVGDRARLVR